MKREWLIEKRNSLGLTQQQVADNSGIERAYYTMIERGLRTPSVTASKAIATTLNFEWTYFFEEKCNVSKQLKVN